ncbi:MAG TPA: peptidoglycan-binding protein [Aestuariivirga sp.]
MKPGIPWSIKGIEPELREVAKTAARRSGMTLGEWLNSAINEQADAPAEGATPGTHTRTHSLISTHPIERAASRLEDIAEQLARISSRESETAHRPVRDPEEQFAFAKVLSRVESNEKQTVEAFSAVNERLATISRQITRTQPPKMEEAPGFQAMEKAVRNIVEHLEIADKRTRENMKSLQDRMGDMSSRISTSNSEQLLRQAPAFSQMEQRLSELARRVEQPQVAQPSEQLRQEINSLAGRIDSVRETSEALATRAQTQAVQTAQAELRAIEGRIIGLINEAKQSISAAHVGPAELQRFRQEIEKVNARVENVAATSPNHDQDVTALKVAVEQLSTRVAQGQDQRPLADLDRKILEIARKLEETELASKALPQASDLEQRFSELDQRLSHSLANPAQNNNEVEQKLVEVDERLARTEHQLSHLQTIESAITQLYDSMEKMRGESHDIAQAAVERATELRTATPAQHSLSLAGTPEIIALESGLKAVREAAMSADYRNQETLEAVHETLEQIVAKLTELETASIGQRLSQAAGMTTAAAPLGQPLEAFTQPATLEEPSIENENHAFQSHMDSSFPAEEQDELGTYSSAVAPDAAPLTAGPLTAGALPGFESEIEPISPVEENKDAGIGDIVAAARRLHQAAQTGKGTATSGPSMSKAAARPKKGFSFPFLSARNGKRVDGAPQTETGKAPLLAGLAAAQTNDSSRRRLVLVGVLLLALAGFGIKNFQANMNSGPVATPATIEQTTPRPIAPIAPQTTQPDVAPLVPQDNNTKATVDPAQQGAAVGIPPIADPITTGAITDPVLAPGDVAVAAPNTTPVTIEAAIGPVKLRQAAEHGDATAQFIVATHYLEGDTAGVDFAKAAYWYGKAAASGLPPAQYRLASLYERGKGVAKNLSAALAWYEKAADLGNVKAMHNAAVLAAGTDIGAADYATASHYFALAAAHGLKDSQYNLAVLIERGLGVKADVNDALFWYMAAAAQGDTEAKTKVDALSKTMAAATLDAVQNRFKNWTPEKATDAANTVPTNDAQWNPPKAASLSPPVALPSNLNDQTKALLAGLGYQVGALDGGLDARTASAIRLFQLKSGMKVTGLTTPGLVAAIQSQQG